MHKNNKKILQTQQRFTCESHNAFTEKKKKRLRQVQMIVKECNQLIR